MVLATTVFQMFFMDVIVAELAENSEFSEFVRGSEIFYILRLFVIKEKLLPNSILFNVIIKMVSFPTT